MRFFAVAYALFLFLLIPGILKAQKQEFKNEFGFRSDNDAYLANSQDRYYTNGLFITFRHALKTDTVGKKTIKKTWEAEIGQRMYNAQSGAISSIDFVDRPFAAYLYAGGKLNWFYKKESALSISLQTGMIGPAAAGKEIQELLHSIVGFYKINGWQYQVKNEFQVNLAADYTRLFGRNSNNTADISFEGQIRAGTTFSGTGAGLLIRLGSLNPFSSSASMNSRISNSGEEKLPAKEIFLFLRPKLNFVAYDATLRGGMFRKDKGPVTYKPNPLLFSNELGIQYAYKRWSVNFSVTFLSKEAESMVRSEQYGGIGLYYRFGQ